jgi:hypothetical protein
LNAAFIVLNAAFIVLNASFIVSNASKTGAHVLLLYQSLNAVLYSNISMFPNISSKMEFLVQQFQMCTGIKTVLI